MYGSNDMTFGKKQYYEGSKEISGCQEMRAVSCCYKRSWGNPCGDGNTL